MAEQVRPERATENRVVKLVTSKMAEESWGILPWRLEQAREQPLYRGGAVARQPAKAWLHGCPCLPGFEKAPCSI